MIADILLGVLLALPNMLLDTLGALSLSIPTGFVSGLSSIFGSINYFVPITQLMPILVIEFAVVGFKIIWAIVVRVKSFIPTMGS